MDDQATSQGGGENWITLTDADVMQPNSPERLSVAAVKGIDDLAAICGQVTEQVRQAYILSERDLGDDGTIPSGLKFRAVAIALWRFVSEGVGKNEGLQTKQREAAFNEALKYLDRIAASEIGHASAPSVGKRPKWFGPRREDGI